MQVAAIAFMMLTGQSRDLTAYMQKLAPRIPEARIRYLADLIESKSLKYDIDPYILAAIVRQESGFRKNQVSCQIRKGIESCDVGISQINSLTAKEKRFDFFRLIWDENYNLEKACEMLHSLKKQFPEENNYYGRYHDSRPRQRAVYEASLDQLINEN